MNKAIRIIAAATLLTLTPAPALARAGNNPRFAWCEMTSKSQVPWVVYIWMPCWTKALS